MCVHKPWHDNHGRGVNHLSAVRIQVWSDSRDFRPFDQHVGLMEVANLFIEGEDNAALDERSIYH
jgi:hypothetical protein